MEVSRRVFKNTIFLYTAQIVNALALFILTLVMARTLGSVEFGKFAFTTSLIAIFSVFAELGITTYFIKEGSQDTERLPVLLGQALVTRIFTSVIIYSIVCIYSFLLIPQVDLKFLVIIFGLSIMTNVIPSIISSLLRIHEQMKYEAFIQVISALATSIFGIFLITSGHGVKSIFLVMLGVSVLGCLLYLSVWVKKKKILPLIRQSIPAYITFFKKGLPFAVLVIMGTIYFRIATVMIEYMKGPTDVGQYNAAYRLMEGLLFIPAVFSGVILPVISKNIKTNIEQIRVSSHQVIKFLLFVSVPLAFGIVLLSHQIILLLYGNQYSGAIPVLQYLGPTFLALFVSAITSTLINASSRPIINTYIATFMVLFNVALNFLLIPRIGITGAAIATLLTEAIGLSIGTWYIHTHLFRMAYLSFFAKPILAAVGMSIVILIFPTLYALPLFIITYIIFILLFRYFNKEDIRLLRGVIFKPKELPSL